MLSAAAVLNICILDLSLADLLLIFPIWICHFYSVVSMGVEPDSQASE